MRNDRADVLKSRSVASWMVLSGVLLAGLGACGDATETNDEVAQQTSALTDSLEAYSQKCDAATGVTVRDFNCDSGTLVPTTHQNGSKCDQPNRLHQECDPGSRFQVLVNTADAYVVAHCRKQNHANGRYGDIAVIQHSKRNGATCFYQALGDLNGNVKAPSRGTGAWPWKTPAGTASDQCVSCHDNGPIIRSPYLTQVTGSNKLPGAGDPTFNKDQPYYFVGNDFASWKAYKVEVAGNMCNGCHRMGVSNIGSGSGTSLHFGPLATAMSEPNKNDHGPDSRIWMTPGQTYYNPTSEAAAQEIRACAARKNESPLPSSPSCKITQFTSMPAPSVPGRFTAVWEPNNSSEIQVYGWSYADYRNKYDQLWGQGWRLYSLQPYVVNNQVRYNAVWRPSTEGEIQVYGWSYADYRAQYDQLWNQGWRLKLLEPYVLNGNVYYTAVWKQSTSGEYQVYGWSYADFRARYDDLWNQGWRLKILRTY